MCVCVVSFSSSFFSAFNSFISQFDSQHFCNVNTSTINDVILIFTVQFDGKMTKQDRDIKMGWVIDMGDTMKLRARKKVSFHFIEMYNLQ